MPESLKHLNSKIIEVGKFYFVHDGSKTGHPGLIVWKDDLKNRYLVIRFDSDKYGVEKTKKERGIKHITQLRHPTSKMVLNSYVHNRPMLCKRNDIGNELFGLSVSPQDREIIEIVSKKKPELSRSIK